MGAELHLVGAVRLGPAQLVLDRERHRPARRAVQLDQIGDADQAQGRGAQRHAGDAAHALALLLRRLVHPVVREASLGGQRILGPDPLDVNQRALPRAIQPVLQRGDGDEVVFVGHGRGDITQIRSMTSMPSGITERSMVTS